MRKQLLQAFSGTVSDVRACNCIGPQDGEPLCPCQMRGVVKRNGRWIKLEQDLGPILGSYDTSGEPA